MRSLKQLRVIIFLLEFFRVIAAEEYTLKTTLGDITGLVKEQIDEYTVTQFLGIPFAEPPVGDLRFKKPVPTSAPFMSPFNATQHGPACAQFSVETFTEKSEDCLFLNVYVPYDMSVSGKQDSKRPVMIWIYGGGFVFGASNYYDASLLSAVGDVIVVTLNYRLAILGFLTTGDDVLPGNLGLWDQHVGIKWVHDYIDAFGGDADRVTLFGNSAGSASIVYQSFYPGNTGLFRGAIAQSGSLTSPWAYKDKQSASRNVDFLAERVGCTQTNTVDIIDCMRQVPKEQFDGPGFIITPEAFTPVVDGEIVLDTPANLLYGKSTATKAYDMFNSVDLMTGFTSADGLGDALIFMGLLGITDPNEFKITKDQFEDDVIPYYLSSYGNQQRFGKALRLAVINEYTDWSDPYSDTKRNQQLTNLITEQQYTAPSVLTANLHSNSSTAKTFVYEFAVRPLNHLLMVPPPLDGNDVMNHADEITFLFGLDIAKVMADEQYFYLLHTYQTAVTLWTNFAKSRDPNLPRDVSSLINTTWPEYSSAKQSIRLSTAMSPQSVKTRTRQRPINFWNNIVPSLIESASKVNVSRDDKPVTITTPIGDIIGVESYVPVSNYCGFRVVAYRGIPYAEAPVENRRFQKPVPKGYFSEPFNATQYGPACYQLDLPNIGASMTTPRSEDCLLLNVFVPNDMNTQESTNKAVMIWIHGGDYITGESNMYDPRVLVGYSDVIVVTINYRLSYYGFMTTGDDAIPSNLGLWDQHTAIKWVHDNIGAFGGDTNRVTIFGNSAGASSIGYQVFYPGNRGLFQRAIGQSGTMGNPGSYSSLPATLQNTRKFSELTGCSLSSSTTFLECLQSKPIEDLQKAVNSIGRSGSLFPTRDNVFVLDTPKRLISGTTLAREAVEMFHSVDYLTGFANADGLFRSEQWPRLLGQSNLDNFTLSRSDFEDKLVPELLSMAVVEDTSGYSKRSVIHEYTDWTDPDSEQSRAQQLVDMYTDAMFAVPAIRAADLHTMSPVNRNTYLYTFSVRPLERVHQIPVMFDGPNVMNHADGIQFVLGTDISAVSDSEEHHQLFRVHQATMTMWSNFAKSGNPNTPNDVTKYIYTSWPQYESSRRYLEITPDVTQNAAKQRPRPQAVDFWSRLLPEASSLSERAESCTRMTSAASHIERGTAMLFSVIVGLNTLLFTM